MDSLWKNTSTRKPPTTTGKRRHQKHDNSAGEERGRNERQRSIKCDNSTNSNLFQIKEMQIITNKN